MESNGEQTHYVKRVVLPSGKTIEVVYFREAEAHVGEVPLNEAPVTDEAHAVEQPPQSRIKSFTCAWTATPSSSTRCTGRRPARRTGTSASTAPTATWYRDGVFAQETVEAFDEELDRGSDALARDYKRLMRANMAEEIDRFVGALDADAILPEDFSSPAP